MTIRHIATTTGLITLLLVTALGLTRHDNPEPYMIISDTEGDAFLYHEASGDLISVTKKWGDYKFSSGQLGSNRHLYATTPDGWLVMGYSPNSAPMRTASFTFNPLGTIARPVLPGEPEATFLASTPDKEWVILNKEGFVYRQKIGSDKAELITEQGPLAFYGWLNDKTTMIVKSQSAENSLLLLNFRTGDVQHKVVDGELSGSIPALEPGWFLVRVYLNTDWAMYAVNLQTGERIEVLPSAINVAQISGFDATGQSLVYLPLVSQTARNLWRVDEQNNRDLLIEDVAFAVWSPDHSILLVYTEIVQERGLWLIPTDTWQPLHVYTTMSRHLSLGFWLDDEVLFADGNSIFSAGSDEGSWEILYELPVTSLEIKDKTPDGEWLIVQGQDVSLNNRLYKIRTEGSEMEMLLPEKFALGSFHGWLPVTSYDWHFIPFLGIGGIFMVVSEQGLWRRRRGGSN
jgi:hypothetical protein